MNNNIGILGCGWLGFPLAISLKDKGYLLHGSSTSKSKLSHLEKQGIHAFQIELHADRINGPVKEFLKDLDVLIINVPPGMRNDPQQQYYEKIKMLYGYIKNEGVAKIIFVSSTSVYGVTQGEVADDFPPDPVTESAKQLVAVEKLFLEDNELKTTVIRFGGLIGPGRHPVNRLAGKTDLGNGDDAVNLIHLDDCIHMICTIIRNEWWNEIFNGVYPDHPIKADYYRKEAIKRGLTPPTYSKGSGLTKGKIIESKNFLNKGQQFYTSIHT